MRTDLAIVAHWVLTGGEPPYKIKTMLKCLEQLEKLSKKARERLEWWDGVGGQADKLIKEMNETNSGK